MKVVILAGGLGTRISEESINKPKPMIEIGGLPILWHIMKIYSYYGFNEFIICAGYKQNIIKEWFSNYYLYKSDITFDYTSDKNIIIQHNHIEPWKVTIVDTGLNTETGGRVKKIISYIGNESFMLTYGDAVGNININTLLEYHKKHNKIGTISIYNFAQRKGIVDIKDGNIIAFREKADVDSELINIGFMVFEPRIFEYIYDDFTVLERETMQKLVHDNELTGYMHKGWWQCMDTLREKLQLEKLWNEGNAPWKIWDN